MMSDKELIEWTAEARVRAIKARRRQARALGQRDLELAACWDRVADRWLKIARLIESWLARVLLGPELLELVPNFDRQRQALEREVEGRIRAAVIWEQKPEKDSKLEDAAFGWEEAAGDWAKARDAWQDGDAATAGRREQGAGADEQGAQRDEAAAGFEYERPKPEPLPKPPVEPPESPETPEGVDPVPPIPGDHA